MGKFVSEFKEFVMRGNVLDLAVGVIIGGAFQSIVSSLCNDVILPGVSWIVATVSGMNLTNENGELDFSKVTGALNVGPIAIGNFVSAVINFLIMALIIFCIVKGINKLMSVAKKPAEAPAATTKKCPFCFSEVDINATRCAHCTSVIEIEAAAEEKKEDDAQEEAKEEASEKGKSKKNKK